MESEGSTNQTVNFSGQLDSLVSALAKATLEFKPVVKGNKNPFFKSKYADLTTLIEATREPLAKNGLVVAQFPGEASDGRVVVITALLHSSGQWLRSEIVMPCGKPDAQGVGSALTYGRRYAYGAMLSLGAEDDDDAEGSIDRKTNEVRAELNEKMSGQERIGQFQVKAITEACQKAGKSTVEQSEYLERLHIKQWEQLQKQDFQAALKWAMFPVKTPAKVSGSPESHAVEMKRIFATAADRGIPELDVKRYAYETHKVDSMTKLGKPQLQEVLDWVSGA